MNDFAKLKLDINKHITKGMIAILEVWFDLSPKGNFADALAVFNELELKNLWGPYCTTEFKNACSDNGWVLIVDLIENYERKVPPILVPPVVLPVHVNQNAAKTVFISYFKNQREEMLKIKAALEKNNISVISDPGFNEDISAFIRKVRITNFALLLISQEYLQDEISMKAVLELKKDDDFKKKMLLIVHDNANIGTIEETLRYIQYWNTKHENLTNKSNAVTRESSGVISFDLKGLRNNTNEIAEFIADIRNRVTLPLKDLQNADYTQIIQYILTH